MHRVLPVLDAHPPPEDRMAVVGDVARSVDVVDGRAAILVNQNSVVDPDAALVKEVDDRLNADTNDGEIALEV